MFACTLLSSFQYRTQRQVRFASLLLQTPWWKYSGLAKPFPQKFPMVRKYFSFDIKSLFRHHLYNSVCQIFAFACCVLDDKTCTLPKDGGGCDNKIFRYYYNAIEVRNFLSHIMVSIGKYFN